MLEWSGTQERSAFSPILGTVRKMYKLSLWCLVTVVALGVLGVSGVDAARRTVLLEQATNVGCG